MNKSELVDRVAAAAEVEKRAAERAVDAVLDTVIAETRSGNKVSLFGFGTFSPKARPARIGRNPQTGEAVPIAASNGVKFSPASAFKSALNARGGGKKAASTSKATATKATARKATAKTATKASKQR